MRDAKQLHKQIIGRVNANLCEFDFDTGVFSNNTIEYDKLAKFYSLYGITSHHPTMFNFIHSCMAGSYFLGKCFVGTSIVYKSDVRGDELRREGDVFDDKNSLSLLKDETIAITYSFLYKTLVHNYSHNPGTPEEFTIQNTISAHYANIHGTTVGGCFLGAFSTVDLMSLHSCIVGEFSYIQAKELFHKRVEPGLIWIKSDDFEFKYSFSNDILDKYIGVNEVFNPRGIIYNFVKELEPEFDKVFDSVHVDALDIPESSAVNKYSVIKGDTQIGENVFVSQKAYLDSATMGDGSNSQENSYIINSKLKGLNVTAHGAKIINSDMGRKVFVGFNSFLRGGKDARLSVGDGCVIMPHTIIDIKTPVKIPEKHLIWGFIQSRDDLKTNSIALSSVIESKGALSRGQMMFTGDGNIFINSFADRIDHILDGNGAYFDGKGSRGHAQNDKHISFNTIQPYTSGDNKGIYPSISIEP